jgi:hypothetical protein
MLTSFSVALLQESVVVLRKDGYEAECSSLQHLSQLAICYARSSSTVEY